MPINGWEVPTHSTKIDRYDVTLKAKGKLSKK